MSCGPDLLDFVWNEFCAVIVGGVGGSVLDTAAAAAANGAGLFHSASRRGGVGLRPLRASFHSANFRLFNGRGGAACSRERVRCRWPSVPFVRAGVGAPGSPAPVGSAAGGKSLRAAARSRIPAKFGVSAGFVLTFTAHLCLLCPQSQVYGLFEGMLEKLELDDDGKSLNIRCCATEGEV